MCLPSCDPFPSPTGSDLGIRGKKEATEQVYISDSQSSRCKLVIKVSEGNEGKVCVYVGVWLGSRGCVV